ncbi:MAG: TatD family hydrolase [Dethiobacter sp.]|jgi:TatD DNase family protein|nr:TatD family hydrolase [Dethiobacter sp.]MBS3989300.1 TatD family hydrolase [Dethiobacter sp.]
MALIDTHAHLTDNRFARDLDEVLLRAEESGISAMINVGYDLPSSRRCVALAAKREMLFATVGIHPHEAAKVGEQALAQLRQLALSGKVVALGEMGLDYYYNHSPRDLQQELFRRQIRLAKSLSLPIIVHDRDAHEDVLTILREEGAETVGGVLHCFSGNRNFALRCLALGFHISLAGPVTFSNSRDLAAVAEAVPADKLLLETDAPYLAPVPYRGKRNEPAYLLAVAEKVAALRSTTVEELSDCTTENAKKLFKLEIKGNSGA